MAKRQFVECWLDMPTPHRKHHAMTRDRVAYLLRAARSRRDQIHRIHRTYGYDYQIGYLAINERHSYHDSLIES